MFATFVRLVWRRSSVVLRRCGSSTTAHQLWQGNLRFLPAPSEHYRDCAPATQVDVHLDRAPRTNMPTTDKLLQSAHDETAHDALVVAKQRQASYYDRGAKPRPPLSVEDTVRAQWDSNSNWEKAEVTKVLPHRSYQLRLKTAPRNGEHQSM